MVPVSHKYSDKVERAWVVKKINVAASDIKNSLGAAVRMDNRVVIGRSKRSVSIGRALRAWGGFLVTKRKRTPRVLGSFCCVIKLFFDKR